MATVVVGVGTVLVEEYEEEGDALIPGDGTHVLVHGGEGGDGGQAPDAAGGAEGDGNVVAAGAPAGEEGEAVAEDGAGHDYRGGALGELEEAEDVELEGAGAAVLAVGGVPTTEGLDEADE